MTDHQPADMDRTSAFQRVRPRLLGIAYRMLGSRADAEDAVQDAYLRWFRTDTERVDTPEAWLTTTITRLCIDRLRSARVERDTYSGPWLPEPFAGGDVCSPDQAATLASDLSMAFLVVLERLAPEERAAFLLHEAFDCGYPEIAVALGKSEAACRQIVHRARARVRSDRPRFRVSEAARRRLLEKFRAAMSAADQTALIELFTEDASWTADGGGKVPATSKVLRGNARIAKLLAGFGRRFKQVPAGKVDWRFAEVNGETGLVLYLEGRPFWVLCIETDGSHILAGYVVLNPEKLKALDRPSRRLPGADRR